MSRIIIGFDFSMAKPARCVLKDDLLNFYTWPVNKHTLNEKNENILSSAGVCVHTRNRDVMSTKDYTESQLICEHVSRAIELAGLIRDKILEIVGDTDKSEVIIANEGLAFSARGNVTLDLSGYKYILMDRLMSAGFTNFVTYSPINIKKTAGCSKKGMGKDDMIEAFKLSTNYSSAFRDAFLADSDSFRAKTNYIPCMDDLADSYWCLMTAVQKQK